MPTCARGYTVSRLPPPRYSVPGNSEARSILVGHRDGQTALNARRGGEVKRSRETRGANPKTRAWHG